MPPRSTGFAQCRAVRSELVCNDGGWSPRNPVVGTRLVREWDGAEHTTILLRDGYEFEGRKYKSLSAIARDITGTRWNGYRFFGLREAPRHSQ